MVKVLLVEDDLYLARALIRALSAWSCTVTHASNRADGLRAVELGGYDAIVCDWDLGDGIGAAVVMRSLELHPRATRVVCSGRSVEELSGELPPDAVQTFVQKPCHAGVLARAIGLAC